MPPPPPPPHDVEVLPPQTSFESLSLHDEQKLAPKVTTTSIEDDGPTATTAPKKKTAAQSAGTFELLDFPINAPRKTKVIVVGAGIAGITAGILLPAKVSGLDLVIYEKNPEISGTWFENIYPGVRCDIPAHVYQATFEPNRNWSEPYAQGHEIKAYWESVAKKYDVYRYLKLSHEVVKAEWDDAESIWRVRIHNRNTGEVFEDTAEVLTTALGRFNDWKLPNYPGLDEYKGHLRHSSNWDPNFEPAGKRVAVIGNGASGLQLVPQLQKVVQHLDHYARNPTWVASSFGGEKRDDSPFTAEQLASFQDDATYHAFRKSLESKFFRRFGVLFTDSEIHQQLRRDIEQQTRERLKDRPDLLEKGFFPEFPPCCRRLTPGPGYLEALAEENVSYIQTPIERFTEAGIRTVDGVERPVDAIICSTGANGTFAPPFPVISRGIDLKEAWEPNGSIGYPETYLGNTVPNFPNFFMIAGPAATAYAGTVPHGMENQVTYLAKLLRKFTLERIKTIVPSRRAVDDFIEFSNSFFTKTVMAENCSSWYNGGVKGGLVYAVWPGSATHAAIAKRDPRWEDYEYTYRHTGNRFAYFGNGWSTRDMDDDSDPTPYLQLPGTVDLKTYHETWIV